MLTHAIGTVNLGKLHTADDQAGNNLAGVLDNGVLSALHVEAAHTAKLFDLLHGDKSLDGEGTERTFSLCQLLVMER